MSHPTTNTTDAPPHCLSQLRAAYELMALQARYRPAAPSDGHGNITTPLDQLNLATEADAYARHWWTEEQAQDFAIGCPDYPDRGALVYAIEGARLICGAASDPTTKRVAAQLLRMAADEIEPSGTMNP